MFQALLISSKCEHHQKMLLGALVLHKNKVSNMAEIAVVTQFHESKLCILSHGI